MAAMTEAEMAEKVVAWLESQHWDVYQEVEHVGGGRADIVAVRAKIVWIIECKLTFGLSLLAQIEQRDGCHMRSVAVPAVAPGKRFSSERHFAERLLTKHFSSGLIEVGAHGVQEKVPAPLLRHQHKHATRVRLSLRPEHKTWAKAGTKHGYFTPYQNLMGTIRRFLKTKPDGASLKEIMDFIGDAHHYRSHAGLRSSLPKVLSEYEADWCSIQMVDNKKVYSILPTYVGKVWE